MNAALATRWIVPGAAGFGWDWGGDEALDSMLWPVAQSAGELLTGKEIGKIRQCATRGCRQLFVRRSPRRLWCDANTCGNRPKGKKYHDMIRRIRKSNPGMPAAQIEEYMRRRREDRPEDERSSVRLEES